MKASKWFAPALPYLAVWAGLYWFKNAWLALIGFHAAMLFVLGIARPEIPINILFRSRHPRWILSGMGLSASCGIAIYYLHSFLGIADDLSSQLEQIGLNRSTWPMFIAYFSLVNPFVEEYFWRGFLGSDAKGLHVGDLFYAGYHGLVLIGKIHPLMIFLALAGLIFIGWFWRQIRRTDDGLLIPVFGHLTADLSILISVYLIAR
jgi:hypothetical protein